MLTSVRSRILSLLTRAFGAIWARWDGPLLDAASDRTRRRIRAQARAMGEVLARVDARATQAIAADEALRYPVDAPRDTIAFHRPALFGGGVRFDVARRPESGLPLGPDTTLHHDMTSRDFALVPLPDGHGVEISGLRADGSFVSLVMTLPDSFAERAGRANVLRLTHDIALDAPVDLFARLNLREGPNVAQINRSIDLTEPDPWVEFDLFYADLEGDRMDRMWIDLIFQPPRMNAFRIRDVSAMLRPRVTP